MLRLSRLMEVHRSDAPALAHDGGSSIDASLSRRTLEAATTATLVGLEAAHGQAMWGFARRLGLSEDEAQDVVQESLLRLWRELVRGSSIADPVGWVFRTSYRAAMDEHRARRRLVALRDRLVTTRPSGSGVDAADRLAVWSEVDRLPERQRHVLYLRYRADRSFEQVGQILGMSTATARSHCSQAVRTLRERLGEDLG
jgi:RNA polymerase sigma factor (sigma-70 family)